ncbi:response regulator transcription factor [Actinoplanes philippinensis]|uniref:response regulator transcription factor n=1 Tax=Actinoplanes philippinensis TaxID=35752 RepID=UPI0033EE2713
MTGKTYNLLLVDDHPVLRRGLRAMLTHAPWVHDVHEADSAADALEAVVTTPVDVVALDLLLPDGNGIDVVRAILRAAPDTRILILTSTEDPAVGVEALAAGAHGYLVKDTDPDVLVSALHGIAHRLRIVDPRVDPAAFGPAKVPPPFDKLTSREMDILHRLVACETNAQIARHFHLSENTVRNLLTNVYASLGVNGRVEAITLAQRAHLFPP